MAGSLSAASVAYRVARRAGTNKNAIYRRWPNRAALGIAASQQPTEHDQAPPDSGDLRGDVLELLRRANRLWSSPRGDILRGLLAGAASDPELLALLRDRAGDGGSALWLTVLRRAAPAARSPRRPSTRGSRPWPWSCSATSTSPEARPTCPTA